MIVDGIHGTPSDSAGLPSLFAGTDIRLAISSCCKRYESNLRDKKISAKAIRKANASVEQNSEANKRQQRFQSKHRQRRRPVTPSGATR